MARLRETGPYLLRATLPDELWPDVPTEFHAWRETCIAGRDVLRKYPMAQVHISLKGGVELGIALRAVHVLRARS